MALITIRPAFNIYETEFYPDNVCVGQYCQNNDYFSKQHLLIGLRNLDGVFCEVGTGFF
jgi:hypothetical protein